MNTTPINHKIEFMALDKYRECFCDGSMCIRIDGELFDNNEYALMQLTALRSINDEPIYNHMIVKDQYGDMYTVDIFNYHLMAWLSSSKLEIVGNRFQSPELLELCR